MTSYAELLQTCAEFQGNFAALNGKYNAQAAALKNAQATCAERQAELKAAAQTEEKLQRQIAELKQELAAAAQLRGQYWEANTTAAHLSSQLASARQSAADALMERDQEVSQLKDQIADLLKRIDTAANSQRLREMQQQVVELEERCSSTVSQLREAEDRHSQQLLTAHNALREQQSRNLELEQRFRVLEGEATELRTAARRYADLQNEAILLKERYATTATVAQHESAELQKEVEGLRRRLVQAASNHQAQVDADRRMAMEERHGLEERLAALATELEETQKAVEQERQRFGRLQADTQVQVARARDAALLEASAARRSHAAVKEENMRLRWQIEKMEGEATTRGQLVMEADARCEVLDHKLQQMQSQLDTAAQQEAWLTSEKRRASEEVCAMQERIDELHKELQSCTGLGTEVERLRMVLDSTTSEMQETRRYARQCNDRQQDLEEVSARQMRTLRQELKAYKKQLKTETARADKLRRHLAAALAEKEAALYQCMPRVAKDSSLTRQGGAAAAPADTSSGGTFPSLSGGAYGDVLDLLRSQNDQAEQIHHRLLQLAR